MSKIEKCSRILVAAGFIAGSRITSGMFIDARDFPRLEKQVTDLDFKITSLAKQQSGLPGNSGHFLITSPEAYITISQQYARIHFSSDGKPVPLDEVDFRTSTVILSRLPSSNYICCDTTVTKVQKSRDGHLEVYITNNQDKESSLQLPMSTQPFHIVSFNLPAENTKNLPVRWIIN